ncbi:zinc carboxypeptidase A 1-like isoform X1 [Pogonomyrmex barbatus]|uniref:Zinc carboxypeptidase A 1 n=1 Tax=Pogonomyrmex barbatus TaxID=144034 RepID=A0A6I9WXG4_9HYME|nr:zinc carboxypeptidase A 1-like isoform X1 [Pogonomyrmex barbatus]
MWWIIILCVVAKSIHAVDKAIYENYKLFSVIPRNESQLDLLKLLRNTNNIGVSFWREPSVMNREIDIMVPPHKLSDLSEILGKIGAPYDIKIHNIQKLIDNTMLTNQSNGFDFTNYHTLEDIYDYLENLTKLYPKKVEIIVGGTTFEGREIRGVKVTFHEENPGVFIEGGIHAREWIATSTVLYILDQLLTSNDSEVRRIAESHNWYIFPSFNPDGYVFTHTQDRLWKKTLKPSSPFCIGSDPNRNWGFEWNTSGTNNDPCSEMYPGSKPFSEIEMKSLSEYIWSNLDNFYVYIAFHSFSQLLLFPYGYREECMFFHEDLFRVGRIAIEALKKRHGTQYAVGCFNELYNILNAVYTKEMSVS